MKRLLIFAIIVFAFSTKSLLAQTTNLTLQVTDSGGQSWNNGTWTVTLSTPAGVTPYGPPFYNINTTTSVPNQSQTGTLSGTGSATMTLTQNSGIAPARSQWLFVVCPQVTGAQCFTQLATITATTTLTLTPPAPSVNAGPGVVAYLDSEINSTLGQTYFNVVSNAFRICLTATGTSCSSWTSLLASGAVSFSSLSSGTNASAAMLVGTGASLGATGSGTLTATAMPWSGLSAFPTGCTNQVITAILTAPTCTTLTSSFLPGALVYNNQTNVYGAFLQNFTSGTMEIPEGAGFTTNVNSTIGLDITANITHLWTNNADSLAVVTTGTSVTTTQPLFATAVAGIYGARAIATGDLPTAIPIGNIGTSGLSGTAPATISAAGAIGCATCVTSAASITSNVLLKGSGGAQGVANSLITDNGTTATYTGTGGYSAPVLASTVATGTAPLTVTSTTPVTNLTLSAVSQLPSSVVSTGQANTGAAAMTLNMAASTTANSFVAPAQAGLTSGTNGAIAYDTTNGNTHVRTNAADSIAVAEAAALAANVIPKQTDATHGLVAASLASDNGTALTYTGTGGVLSSGNNAILTTDFTDTSSASLQNVTGLNFTLPANTARNYEIDCNLMWSQATFSGITDQFGLQDVTVAPTRIDGYGLMSVAGPGAVITNAIYGVLTNLTTTTATAIVSAIPTVATINFAQLHFTVQQPSNASTSVLQIMVSQSTAADVIVVRAGSSCRLN